MSTTIPMGISEINKPRKIYLNNSNNYAWMLSEFDGILIGRIELGTEDRYGIQRLSQGILQVALISLDKNDREIFRRMKNVCLHEFIRNDMIQPFLDVDWIIHKANISEYDVRNAEYWVVELAIQRLELLEGETLALIATAVVNNRRTPRKLTA